MQIRRSISCQENLMFHRRCQMKRGLCSPVKLKKKSGFYTGTSPDKKRNKSLKRTLIDIEQEEQKLSDELEHIHSVYIGIIGNMQDTSVKLEQYARVKGSEARYLSKEMQKLQEMR